MAEGDQNPQEPQTPQEPATPQDPQTPAAPDPNEPADPAVPENVPAQPGHKEGDDPSVPSQPAQPSPAQRLDALEFGLAKKDAIDAFLKQDEYKDVPRNLLEKGNSDEEIKDIADIYLANIKLERNKALEEKQNESVPRLSEEDARKKREALKGSGDMRGFVELQAATHQAAI